ncbi:MAG: hypothetical protein LBV32_10795 [Tannerellaceae bacterium]|jgi:hypothetical protein|nr:hypothetical protein [Tannerellaceae bacterium]
MAKTKYGGNSWMAFNRENQPIGFNTDVRIETESKDSALPVYASFFGLSNEVIMELTDYDESVIKRDERGNICQFWLYSDATNPMNQRSRENKFWKLYWDKLEILSELTIIR